MSQVIKDYERCFAETVEAPAARAFTLGRLGLYAVLRALGIGPGNRVGVCGYTCLSVVEAVLRTGATCEFLDVDEWLNISPACLWALPPNRIQALITQYTFGIASGLDEAMDWGNANDVPVVEDCCHALGSRWNGKHVGSYGVAAIYSTQWGKSFSTGQGGLLTLNDQSLLASVDTIIEREARSMTRREDVSLAVQRGLYRALVHPATFHLLRRLHRAARCLHLVSQSFSSHLDFSDTAGFVVRAGPALATEGLRQLRQWPDLLRRRAENAQVIRQVLLNGSLPLADYPKPCSPVPIRVSARVRNKTALLGTSLARSLGLAGWYDSVVHPVPNRELAEIGYEGQCPVSESAIGQVVHLPTDRRIDPKRLADLVTIAEGMSAG